MSTSGRAMEYMVHAFLRGFGVHPCSGGTNVGWFQIILNLVFNLGLGWNGTKQRRDAGFLGFMLLLGHFGSCKTGLFFNSRMYLGKLLCATWSTWLIYGLRAREKLFQDHHDCIHLHKHWRYSLDSEAYLYSNNSGMTYCFGEFSNMHVCNICNHVCIC